jgi:hypothetical protein
MNSERIHVPTPSHRRGRRLAAVLAAIAAGLLIAACGSSSGSGSGGATSTTAATGSGFAARRAALASCLKSHGVTLPARAGRPGAGAPPAGGPPAPGAGTVPGAGRGPGFFGARRPNAKTQAALKACGANFGAGRRSQISHTAIDNFVACVRQHGYNMPAPDFSGTGPTFPSSIRTNTKFIAASRSCGSLLRPPNGGGAPPGTTSTSSS